MYNARSLEKKRNARTQLNLFNYPTTGTKRPMENVDGIDVGGQPKKAKGDVAGSMSKDGPAIKPVKVRIFSSVYS